MNEIQIFKNEDFGEVRTLIKNGEPWFVGKDIAEILGYSNTKDALATHVEAEDKEVIQRSENATLEIPNRGLTIINESGLYSLILSSKLPTAKKFKHWITAEVLPTIRKHGAYMTEQTIEQALTNPDFLIRLATQLKDEQTKNKQLEAKVEEQKPKVIFAESVVASDGTILIRELAKLITQNGVKIGEERLFQWMRDNGYLIRKKGTDYNTPTQRSAELGILTISKTVINKPDGTILVRQTPRVTGKGQIYFINKFKEVTQCQKSMTLAK